MIIYESLGFNVYRINYDTNNEYYIIDRGKEYDKTTVPNTPFNREKSGIDTIIKYNEDIKEKMEEIFSELYCE